MTTLDAEAPILHRVSAIVSSKLSLDEMLGEVIGLTLRVTACDACLVYLLDPATKELVLRASQVPHATALGNLRMSIGEGVTGLQVGDRVAAENHKGCGSCANCRRGRYNLCEVARSKGKAYKLYGHSAQGAFAEYAAR